MNSLSSRLIDDAVNEFSRLPGVGKKTALRFALHMLKQDINQVETFGDAVIRMKKEAIYCSNCHNISETELCPICSNPSRNQELVCVVEDIRDLIAIEHTHQFKGVYHVLGGIISPMDGIGPSDLNIQSLVKKASQNTIKEVILALRTTIEGDTTSFFIHKKLKEFNIPISIIARGIAFGDELEYTDEITLGRSIINRTPYQGVII